MAIIILEIMNDGEALPVLRHLFLLVLIGSAGSALGASPKINVVGLFKGTAVVMLNGQQAVLKLNKPHTSGVTLKSADSKSALIEVNGEAKRYYLGRSIGTQYRSHQPTEVVIQRNQWGQYITSGSINGLNVTFLVDTGATSVAMNESVAKRLGIDYRVDGTEGQAMTAGGITRSWMVKLDSVKVGEISVPNVKGAVIQGNTPHYVLLGMSYLDFVSFAEENQTIRLKKKF